MKYLDKSKKIVILILTVVGMLYACKKDPGNYKYTKVNGAIVTGLQPFYTVKKGEMLNISPKISYDNDAIGDTLNYKYTWVRTTFGAPIVLDSTMNFNVKMDGALGIYNCILRITDKRTSVWREFLFKVMVSNETYEGWLLLSEIAGKQSRLDMLSYREETKKYNFMPDILTTVKSSLKLTGMPSFITYFVTNIRTNDAFEQLAVGTSEQATFLGTDTLDYTSRKDFSSFVEDGTNPAIAPQAKLFEGNGATMLWANNDVYANQWSSLFKINRMMSNDATPFKASRFISGSNDAIIFNEEASEFVWYGGPLTGVRYCVNIPDGSLFKSKIDKNLLFMKLVKYVPTGETFAILKDKVGDKVYLARFTRARQVSYAEITNTPMAQAENFEINDTYGYIFYNVGGKVYEYDFNLKVNKEMADYGSRKISLLKFQPIGLSSSNINFLRYTDITKRLVVCSYDESNLNTSGTMDLYSVPPINGPLVKEESFSGMGKIVSITYRPR